MIGSTAYLVVLLFASIALLILLINWKTKLPPFLALLITSGVTAFAAGEELGKIPETLIVGAGDTLGETGGVVSLGAMLGRLLADSGAIQWIANLVIEHSSPRAAPWIMTGIAFIIAVPTVILAGPVYARWISPRVNLEPSADLIAQYTGTRTKADDRPLRTIPI